MSSFGTAGFGTSNFGLGDNVSVEHVAKKWNGTRAIDPISRKFIISLEDGQPESMNPSQEQVYTALTTFRNSATVKGFGADFTRTQLVTDGLSFKMTNEVTRALKQLTDIKQITLDNVQTISSPNESRAQVNVTWTDNLTNTTFTYNWKL